MNKIIYLLITSFIAHTSFATKMDVPGTRVTIDVPSGFKSTEKFSGFINYSLQSTITVKDSYEPFSKISKFFSDETISSDGSEIIEKPDISSPTPNFNVKAFKVRTQINNTTFHKYIIIAGTEKSCAVVISKYPEIHEKILSSVLARATYSMEYYYLKKIDYFKNLEFSLENKHDLKAANRTGSSVIFTKGGIFPPQTASEPIIAVMPIKKPNGFSKEKLKDIGEAIIEQDANLTDISILSGKTLKVNGFDTYFIKASAKDKQSNKKIFLFTCTIDTPQNIVAYLASVGDSFKKEYYPKFVAIIKSFKTTQNNNKTVSVVSHNKITGNFGINLGDTLNKSWILKKIEASTPYFIIKVPEPNRLFSEYHVYVTPKTNVIYKFRGQTEIRTKSELKNKFSRSISLIDKSIGKMDIKVPFNTARIKESHRQVFVSVIGTKLNLTYIDEELDNQATNER